MCVQETWCSTIVGVDTHKYVHVAVAITGRTSELSRSRRSAKQRRTSVLESLEAKREGGSTTYAAKLAAEPLGGTATVCTITHYCRTTVFKYPGCHMSTEDPVPQLVIAEDEAFRAAVVSDLPAYFQQDVFPHYAIDVSLRDAADRVYRKVLSQSKSPNPPIFLVTEEYEPEPSFWGRANGFTTSCTGIGARSATRDSLRHRFAGAQLSSGR